MLKVAIHIISTKPQRFSEGNIFIFSQDFTTWIDWIAINYKKWEFTEHPWDIVDYGLDKIAVIPSMGTFFPSFLLLGGRCFVQNSLISNRYRWSRGKSWQKHKHDQRPRLRMYWFKKAIQKKKKKKLCSMLLYYIILCFGISLKQQLEENAVNFFCIVCSLTTPELVRSLILRNRMGIRHTHQIITQKFSHLWSLKDAVCGRHIWSDEEVKEAVEDWLA